MEAARRNLSLTLVALGAMFALPGVALGQVGLTSGLTQVALVAHVAARGSIQGVGAEREIGRTGEARQVSVIVRMSANTSYRLLVRAAGAPTSRIWARAVTGEFQELTAGSPVTVARDTHCAAQCEREVQYQVEGDDLNTLPVRYEIALSPQL